MKKKVFVGISGGVDSAVAAHLLKTQGYELTGVFMKNWSGEDYGITDECPWEEDLQESIRVCKHLKIEHRTYNFEKEYRKHVMDYFFKQYQLGNTPNPDILCNKYIKFNAFLEKAVSEGADYIATGHYARTEEGNLFLSADREKDQTYFLSGLGSNQLEKTLFPLGRLTKDKTRQIAKSIDLPNAKRKDSQGICFVGKIELGAFLEQKIKPRKGKIVDIDSGKEIGDHRGVWFYTEGQRKGIQVGGSPKPYFVAQKDSERNILYVALGKENPALWKKDIKLAAVKAISGHIGDIFDKGQKLTARIRHRGKFIPIEGFTGINNSLPVIHLSEAAWSPSPGQFLAFYKNDKCLGSGVITGGVINK